MLSEDDRKILNIFSQDCRLTADDLAVRTGLEREYIAQKLKQWEEEKIIVNYRPLINWEKAGDEKVSALIDVKVLPQLDFGFDKIARRIQKFPEITAVSLMSGGYDLSLLIEGKTMKEIALFVAEKLAPLEHVQSTATHFVLRRYKQDGIELTGQDDGFQRLMVSP